MRLSFVKNEQLIVRYLFTVKLVYFFVMLHYPLNNAACVALQNCFTVICLFCHVKLSVGYLEKS